MKAQDFEVMMRRYEAPYSSLTVPPGIWIVVRCDGRAFHQHTANMEKPFDAKFNWRMTTATTRLLQEMNGLYAETHSDECSVLLQPDNEAFGREVQKLVSLSSSIVSVGYNAETESNAVFDARLVALPTIDSVVDYFSWRQADAESNCLSGWAYWLLRRAGKTAAQATAVLDGMKAGQRHDLLVEHGCNFAKLPDWQRCGTGITWREWDSYADLARQVQVKRRTALPMVHMKYRAEYRAWIRTLCERYQERRDLRRDFGDPKRWDWDNPIEVERPWHQNNSTSGTNNTADASTEIPVLSG